MTYAAAFQKKVERDVVEAARALTGLSQASFVKTVLLRESVNILQRAKDLSIEKQKEAEEASNEGTPEVKGSPGNEQGADHGRETPSIQSTGLSGEELAGGNTNSTVPADTQAVLSDQSASSSPSES